MMLNRIRMAGHQVKYHHDCLEQNSPQWCMIVIGIMFLCSLGANISYAGSWSWGNNAPAGTNGLWTIKHIAGETMIGGDAGAFTIQKDGYSTWQQPTQFTTESLTGIAWNGLIYVAITYSGSVYTSSDKNHWQLQSSDTTRKLRDVIWTGTRFVVVGDNGVILNSVDGKIWVTQSSGTTQNLFKLVWNGNVMVATGSVGNVLTSVDGISWVVRSTGLALWLRGIIWDGKSFVAVGASGSLVTSVDGVTWALHTWGTANLNSIAFDGATYVVVGDYGQVQTSTDLINWHPQIFQFTNHLYDVIWNGSAFIAVGTQGVIAISFTGTKWMEPYLNYNAGSLSTAAAISSQSLAPLESIATDGYSTFVAAGWNSTIMYSHDGVQWTQVNIGSWSNPLITTSFGQAVLNFFVTSIIYDGSRFVLAGASTANSTFVLTSADGKNWMQTPSSTGVDGIATQTTLVKNPSEYLLLTKSKLAKVSPDLLGWKNVVISNSGVATTGLFFDGLWDGVKYIVCGDDGSYFGSGLIYTSYDGVVWSKQISNSSAALNSIAWNGSIYVAVGKNGTIITSSDGTTWNNFAIAGLTNDLSKIRWLGSRFWIVGGKGLIMSSTDGLNWQYESQKTSNAIFDIVSMNGTIVAVGDLGTILVSKTQATQNLVASAMIGTEDLSVSQQVTVNSLNSFSMDSYSYTVIQQAVSGTVSVDLYGIATYTPYANFNGNDQFTVRIDFGTQTIATIRYPVVITPVNDAPTTSGLLLNTSLNTDLYSKIIANDVDGDPLNYILLFSPFLGSLSINQNDGSFTYVPNRDQYGNDSFAYLVSDGITVSHMGIVNIAIAPPPDVVAPAIMVGNASGTYVGGVAVSVSVNETSTIYYTLDGTVPLVGQSSVLSPNAPLSISASTTVTFVGVDTAGNAGAPVVEKYIIQTDSDNDGMPDWWESQYNFNPQNPADSHLDPDGDGLTNVQEFMNGSNPLISDIGASVQMADQYVQPGGSFTVPVMITPNSGTALASFNVVFSYDSYALNRGSFSVSGLPSDWVYTATDSPMTPDGFVETVLSGSSGAGTVATAPFSISLMLTANKNLIPGDRYALTVRSTSFATTDKSAKVMLPRARSQMVVANKMTLAIPLSAGWNFIGMPVAMQQNGVADVLSSISGLKSVWSLDQAGWKLYLANTPADVNTLSVFSPGKAYWVQLSKGSSLQTLTVSGAAVVSLLPNNLVTGWNTVATDRIQKDVAGWLNKRGATSIWGFSGGSWKNFIIGSPLFLNSLSLMQPSEGYYVWLP